MRFAPLRSLFIKIVEGKGIRIKKPHAWGGTISMRFLLG